MRALLWFPHTTLADALTVLALITVAVLIFAAGWIANENWNSDERYEKRYKRFVAAMERGEKARGLR